MNEIISIIIPVYNADKYISRCLQSILKQEFKEYKIYLIDDGSIDNSRDICNNYAEKYKQIEIYHKKNGGAASARNFGIDNAVGEYICFIDADDFIHPQYLKILYNNAKEFSCDVSMCDIYITKDNKILPLREDYNSIQVKSNIEILYDCCKRNKTTVTTPCAKLVKKSLFDDIRYPIGRTYEDLATTHKILYRANKVVISKQQMYYYFMSPGSVMRKQYSILNFNSENLAQEERLVFFRNIGDQELYDKLLISVQRNRIANYCKCRKYLKSYKKERYSLFKKYKANYNAIKQNEISIQDKILFRLFFLLPNVCAIILFPLYEFNENRKWR